MGDTGGPYLFDVGVVALAHADTPVSDRALSYVRQAIRGDIDAVVPYPALFGAHVVLTNYYGFSNADAARLMDNFVDAKRIHWHREMPESAVRGGFDRAADHDVDGWDGYYMEVARREGVNTVLTLDQDFDSLEGVSANVILSPEEFATLTEYLES